MNYYRITAYTPYCGEHMTDYIVTDDEEELREFIQCIIDDNAAEWEPCWADYAEEGYDSAEEWQEDYYASCGATVEEISEAEYKEETKPHWPFKLARKAEE